MKGKVLEKKEDLNKGIPAIKDLYQAGSHFGHLKSRSDARSKSFVFTYRNKVAVIDLNKTIESLKTGLDFIKENAQNGAQFLFVGTKMQAQQLIKEVAVATDQPYIIERWPGGLISNFEVVSKTIKKMISTKKDLAEGKLEHLKKKERLKIEKDLAKTKRIFGGLEKLTKKPDLVFLIDANKESNAVAESRQSGIPIVALCDTTSNPREITHPIVANDDSIATIKLVLDLVSDTIKANYKAPVVEEEKIDERVQKVFKKTPERNKRG